MVTGFFHLDAQTLDGTYLSLNLLPNSTQTMTGQMMTKSQTNLPRRRRMNE
jgi:hypothetical protein